MNARYIPVKRSYWWSVKIGDGQQTIGKFYTEIAALELAATLERAFNDGRFSIQQERDALASEVERLRGTVRTSEAIDWSLTADEISRQYRAMALEVERLREELAESNDKLEKAFAHAANIGESAVILLGQRDELQRRIDEAMTQEPVAYRITSDTDCQMRFEYMKSEADFVASEMGPDSVVTPLYAQPIHALALPPGWQVTCVPDVEFQPRDQICILKIGADGRAELGGIVCRLDSSSLFWHFLNDWLLMQESAG